ncbi:spore germination protein GerPE [Peribacillus simplex]|uniref:spore germination protein GerPE n=1 Tax=Peribacillus TaxID=2675229 RepID=UPI00177BD0C7|nr:spore germination protein GerPE [Brevibacillus sp. JNUCC-41]QOS88126.1 spore germination protein GerPE [Brevibacillus sp. JNUCC-41]
MSKVKSISTQTILFSSTMQIGDCSYIDGKSFALAIQKKSETFDSVDVHFEDYDIFKKPIYIPRSNEPVISRFSNPNPFIRVGNVDIIGVSSSSVVGVGNVGHARMESRVKHIREIPKKPEETPIEGSTDTT